MRVAVKSIRGPGCPMIYPRAERLSTYPSLLYSLSSLITMVRRTGSAAAAATAASRTESPAPVEEVDEVFICLRLRCLRINS